MESVGNPMATVTGLGGRKPTPPARQPGLQHDFSLGGLR